jgi:hypothetical protein
LKGVAEMGLPITNQVRCLGIDEQVAQKLRACTGPQRQDRARDILDILVVDMLGQLDRVRARAAAERTFAERKTHMSWRGASYATVEMVVIYISGYLCVR